MTDLERSNSCINRVMQKKNPPVHDMWLDTLKAAPTCGAHADLAAAPPHVKQIIVPQSPRATSARGPQRNRINRWPMADSASRLTTRGALKRGSPWHLPAAPLPRTGVCLDKMERETAGGRNAFVLIPIKLSKRLVGLLCSLGCSQARDCANAQTPNMKHN
ncbi:hypothetical protein GGI35DRAFT_265023 [Trichoderma velutinum]